MKIKDIAIKNGFDPDAFNNYVMYSSGIPIKGIFSDSIDDSNEERAVSSYTKYTEEQENSRKEKERVQQEKQRKDEENKIKQATMIVTTGDLACGYDVIGPVYFLVENRGLLNKFGTLLSAYQEKIIAMRKQNIMSEACTDWWFLYGDWAFDQNGFEAAFYIATEELKKRAIMLGGDAVICMRQNTDIDMNGSSFELQMYGTVVKFK